MTNNRSLLTTTALSGALVVAGVALQTGVASAATVAFNGSANITFATQSVTSTGGQITLPATAASVVTVGAGESCGTGATITLTAPTGVTFNSAPGFTAAAGTATATGFSSGASSVTYVVGTAVTNTTVTIGGTAGAFNLASGTTFTSPVTANRVFTLTNNGCTGYTNPTFANGFQSASAFAYTPTATNATIDTSATGQGRLFVTSATASTRVAEVGQALFATNATLINAAGGTTFAPGTNTGNLSVAGIYGQLSRVYLAPSTGTCQTTAGGTLPTGAVSGSISGNAATFSGLVDGTTYRLCLENNGSTVVQQSTYLGTVTASSLAGSATSTTAIGTTSYSGNATTLNYLTGGSSYQYFVRVTNPTATATPVFVVVTKDDGSIFSGSVTTNLGVNAAALYSVTDLNTATGANLTAADRARVQVLTTSNAQNVSGILYNTATGVVTLSN